MTLDWTTLGTIALNIFASLLIGGICVLAFIGGGVCVVLLKEHLEERAEHKRSYAVMSCPYCRAVFSATSGATAAKRVPPVLRDDIMRGGFSDVMSPTFIRTSEKNEFGEAKAIGVQFFDQERAAQALVDEKQRHERAQLLETPRRRF